MNDRIENLSQNNFYATFTRFFCVLLQISAFGVALNLLKQTVNSLQLAKIHFYICSEWKPFTKFAIGKQWENRCQRRMLSISFDIQLLIEQS